MPRSPVRTRGSTSTAASTSRAPCAAMSTSRARRAGRLVDHAAVREERAAVNNGVNEATTEEEKEPPTRRLGHDRAQAQGDALRDRPREEVLEGRDPPRLPEHRRVRRARVRHRVGRVVLLRRRTPTTSRSPQAASLIAIVNFPEKFRLDYPESETNGAPHGGRRRAVPYAENKERRDYIIGEMLEVREGHAGGARRRRRGRPSPR